MNYQIRLYYGWEEHESGIYHSFVADDPHNDFDAAVAGRLADMLDVAVDGNSFLWTAMYVDLPQSLIERIKADGVREYLDTK